MKRKLNIAFIGIVLLVSSCISKEAKSVLDCAETLIADHPDSALVLLEKLDKEELDTRKAEAEYRLLHIMASDAMSSRMSGVPFLEDEETISSVAGYYSSSRNREKRMLSQYYLGRVQFRNRKYNNAVISFTKALDEAESLDDQHYIGLINKDLAHTCKASFNSRDALSYMKKALKAFELSGDKDEKNRAFLETGKLYYDLEEYNQANRVLKSALILAKSERNPRLEAEALEAYSALELAKSNRQPELAVKMLQRVQNDLGCTLSPEAKGLMAYALALSGSQQAAMDWLEKAEKEVLSMDSDQNESLRLLKFREYQVMLLLGDKTKALAALEQYTASSHQAEMDALKQSVIASQREFFFQQSESAQNKLNNLKLKVIVGLLILNLIAVILYVVSRNKHMAFENRLAEEQAENERLMTIAEELKSKIQTVTDHESGKKYQSVKIDVLERLCEQYYIYEGTDNLQPKILKEVKTVIDEFRENPKKVEEMLDANYDGLVASLRENATFLKEDDIKLYCFVAAGFSSTTISTLIEKDKSVVYNRISRLKTKIASSGIADKARYMKMFEK